MTETKFTPGPWKVSSTFGSVGAIQHGSGFIAFPCDPRSVDESRADGESWLAMRERTEIERESIKAEVSANARLIAAAPELLEALQHAKNSLVAFKFLPGERNAWEDHDEVNLEAVEAAIAKATGGAQ